MARGVERPPSPYRPALSSAGSARTGREVPGRIVGPGRATERLAAGRAAGGTQSGRDTAAATHGALGCGGGARRPARLRGGAPGRSRRCAGIGRDRVSEERDQVGRGGTAIFRDGGAHRELPDRGLSRLRQSPGAGLPGPRALPPQGLGRGYGPTRGCRGAPGRPLRHERGVGPGELAQAMLARAFAAEVPAAWVTGDEIYGNDGGLRRWLEAQNPPYVLAVARSHAVWQDGVQV